MTAGRILLVDDDHRLRELVARGLRAHDFEVVTARDGASAMRSIEPLPDAIVLDVGLPDADGRDVCQALRTRGIQAPVIFLSTRRDLNDRLSGFAVGGDDYLHKPFALAELVARLRAVLRRHSQPIGAVPRPRDMWMDPVHHAVQWRERRVDLTPIEYKLLARLLARPEAVVRRAELREAGWPAGGFVADNTLDQYISRLRRKLIALGAPHELKAARGIGYRVLPRTVESVEAV